MGSATYPPASAGGIKSVQRGLAGGAGTVTITSVDINKSFVNIFGTTSSGNVAVSANVSGFSGVLGASYLGTGGFTDNSWPYSGNATNGRYFLAQNVNSNGANLGGGSNTLVSAVTQGYLSNSTSLVVSGACRWEVVEFN